MVEMTAPVIVPVKAQVKVQVTLRVNAGLTADELPGADDPAGFLSIVRFFPDARQDTHPDARPDARPDAMPGDLAIRRFRSILLACRAIGAVG